MSAFDALMGTRVERVGPDHATISLPVVPGLHQPGGIVHGGAYCTLVETAASLAANAWLDGRGVAVGVSNHTDFVRATRAGTLTAAASPLQRGRRLQLWTVTVHDEQDRLVAHGTVRLANVAGAREEHETPERDTPRTRS